MTTAELEMLREYSIQAPRSLKIDKDSGVIKGVKILGSHSKNGRIYSPQALADASALYEGVNVYDGHDTRKYSDCVGKLHNASVVGDSVYGDLTLKKSHALFEVIMEDAEHSPDNLALSHEVMSGDYEFTVISEGKRIDSISKVDAVAIVVDGGTCSSLLEENIPVADIKTVEQLKDAYPELTEKLLEGIQEAHTTNEKLASITLERDTVIKEREELQSKLDLIEAEQARQARKADILSECEKLKVVPEISEDQMESFLGMAETAVTEMLKKFPAVEEKLEEEAAAPSSERAPSGGIDESSTPFYARGN